MVSVTAWVLHVSMPTVGCSRGSAVEEMTDSAVGSSSDAVCSSGGVIRDRLTCQYALLSQSWGDVYYFCGEDMRFCTCDFKWNLAGWGKALTLWNFVLSSALGLQKLAIRVGMDGLLPGVLPCLTDKDLGLLFMQCVPNTPVLL